MKGIRTLLAAPAALAVASGITMLPVLTSAAPVSAQSSCAGTTLIPAVNGGDVRVPTTTDGSGHLNCNLGLGNAGEAVARLQIALDYCNLKDNLAIDSDYGPLTQEAVEDVQAFYNIPVDGTFGPQTSGRMKWPVAGSNNTKCDWWG